MKYKNINDYELIDMVRENDEYSRDVLYNKYYPVVKSIANDYYQRFALYGHDYDDFFQEALIAFAHSIDRYDYNRDALFYTFTTICINRRLLTYTRNISNKNKNVANIYYNEYQEYVFSDTRDDIDYIFDNIEFDNLIKKVILELPFENSCILELKLNGFTYKEIGILLDVSPSTIEFKNRRCKRYLSNILKSYRQEKTV